MSTILIEDILVKPKRRPRTFDYTVVLERVQTGVDPETNENIHRVIMERLVSIRAIGAKKALSLSKACHRWTGWQERSRRLDPKYAPFHEWLRFVVINRRGKRVLVKEL